MKQIKFLRIVIIIFIVSNSIIFPQVISKKFIDSIKLKIENYKLKDSIKLKLIFENAYILLNVNEVAYLDSLLTEGFEISKEIIDYRFEAKCFSLLGILNLRIGIYDKSIMNFQKSLDLYEKNKDYEGIINANNNIAGFYISQQDFKKAINYWLNSIKYIYQINDLNELKYTYEMLGRYYLLIDLPDKSYKYINLYYKNSNSVSDTAWVYYELANYYKYKKELLQAINYLRKSIEYFKKNNEQGRIAFALVNLADNYYENEDYLEALNTLFEANKINIDIPDRSGEANVYYKIGLIYKKLKQYNNAIRNFLKGLNIAIIINENELVVKIYKELAENYNITSDLKNSIEFYQKYVFLNDSLFNSNKTKIINEISKKYDFQKKEIENQNLIKESNYKDLLILIIISSGLILIIIIFLLIINIYNRKKVNKILFVQNEKITIQTNQLESQKYELELLLENITDQNHQIQSEKNISEKLLLNVLPEQIANRLKSGESPIADHFDEASVIFIDIADFTNMSAKSTPQKMVNMLNEIFSIFDKISAKYGLEKIKTIGDCYMAAAGIPIPREDHAQAIALMALEVMETMKGFTYSSDEFKSSDESYIINFRIGLDCGPIVAGVIGEQKFIYDLWGDMVNTASRMETNGVVGKIQCTGRFKEKIDQIPLNTPLSKVESIAGGLIPFSMDENSELHSLEKGGQGGFYFEERGEIEIKGKGIMKTYFIEGRIN